MTTKAESLLSIERELGVLLHRLRRRRVQFAPKVHPELQPAALPVLLFVIDHEGLRASDIVDHFGIDKGAVSRHVSHLESLGLISRTNDEADRRAQILVTTPLGRERVEQLREERRQVVAGRLADWAADDLAALARHLRRYNSSLEILPDED